MKISRTYLAPALEVIELAVEQCFALSSQMHDDYTIVGDGWGEDDQWENF